MATYLGTSAVFEVRSGATAGNLGGGGFNPANTHFIANWTATNANTASPVVSSVSYSFVAGDVGAYFYVKSGTSWTPGWYPIASVSGGNATLNAAIGAAIQVVSGRYQPSAVAGCATVASPTAGNCGIDYSQQNAAQFTATDLTGATTTCTSATNPFGPQHAGNFLCLASGTGVTAGWYEIVSISGVTATIDRTAGTTYSAVTYYLGGAVSLGGSTTGITDTIFFALGGTGTATGSGRFFIKGNATYVLSGTVSAAAAGNAAWPAIWEGYNAVRGDRPSITSGSQPILNTGANSINCGTYVQFYSIYFLGTGSPVFSNTSGANNLFYNCKMVNTSPTNNHGCFSDGGGSSVVVGCEFVSYSGYGISGANGQPTYIIGCYVHDCGVQGLSLAGQNVAVNNLVVSCAQGIVCNQNAVNLVYGNTVYGTEAKAGVGITTPTSIGLFFNNILYGGASGYGGSATNLAGLSDYNCFFNNTANIAGTLTNTFLGPHDLTAINPSFTSISQVTGTTATSATNVLTDSGQNFTTAGVVAGRDYLHVVSATGATVGIYGITAVGTTTITTDNTIGTGSAITYFITINRNLLPTGAV